MRDKSIKLITTFLVLLFLSSIFNFSPTDIRKNENLQINIKENKPKASKCWDLTGSPILIDDSDPSKNWFYTALNYDWCSGSGNWTDPYVIENITIDGQGSGNCIEIRNSNAYFLIRNNTFYNSVSSYGDAGIKLDNVDNGKIINNNCSDNNSYGIYLYYSNNNTLSGNTANNNSYGIFLNISYNNTLSGNTASNNNGDGIHLNISYNNTLSGNTASNNNGDGIELGWNSYNNTLSGNTANNNNHGISLFYNSNNTLYGNLMNFCGISLYGSLVEMTSHCIDNTNLVNNKPVYYYVNETDLGSSNFTNAGQIILINCNNSIISGLNLSNGSTGIYLYNSNNNTLSGNTASNNNYYGIYLSYSNNNTLSGNTGNNNMYGIPLSYSNNNMLLGNTASNNIYYGIGLGHSDNNSLSANTGNNNMYGIRLYYSNNNTLSGNTPNNNNYGIRLENSSNNIFSVNTIRDNYHGTSIYGGIESTQNLFLYNSFLKNSVHANDNGINNYWNNSVIGNYWDDYNGEDSNTDGIGDTPYYIFGFANNQDNFPIWWDTIVISINTPNPNEFFGSTAPSFTISMEKGLARATWYTIDNGLVNITFTGLTGTINQSLWDILPEGNVIIRFYGNDTFGRIGFAEVTIKKDVTDPVITINNPQNNDVIGATAPNFNITIDEPNLDKIWYSLNGGTNITFTGLTGTINQALWDALPEGNVTIRFYANDTLGRLGFQEVTVVKEITQPSPPGIPGYDLLFLLGIISVIVVIIIKKRIKNI